MKSNMNIDYDNMTNDEILELFKNTYMKIQPNDAMDFTKRSKGTPSLYILKRRLGLNWNDLKIKAGFSDNLKFVRRSKEEYIEIGRSLTVEEINLDIDLPKQETILTYFKTTKISDVWEEVEHEMIKDYIKLLKKDR